MSQSLIPSRFGRLLALLLAVSACAAAEGGEPEDELAPGEEPLDVLDGASDGSDSDSADVGGAITRPLPSFDLMWKAYPNGEAPEVKKLIGGNVNADWITNTCTIRLSRALNYSDWPIPSDVAALSTVKGADGKRYAYRVAEFRRFLLSVAGAPTISVSSTTNSVDPMKFMGHRGIIMFEVHSWSDATGHFNLWDGSRPAHDEYFEKASVVQLWEAP